MNELTEPENVALHAENANLQNELKYRQQLIQHLSNSLDRETNMKTKIRNIFRDVDTGKMEDSTALSYIRMIVGVTR